MSLKKKQTRSKAKARMHTQKLIANFTADVMMKTLCCESYYRPEFGLLHIN
jgi:hypothetical protein